MLGPTMLRPFAWTLVCCNLLQFLDDLPLYVAPAPAAAASGQVAEWPVVAAAKAAEDVAAIALVAAGTVGVVIVESTVVEAVA